MQILIVEDEADTAKSLAMLLELSGYSVQVTADGPSALAAARKVPPDVVLLDLGLPGNMDGWEVVRRLRQMAFARRPQVIAVTGFGQDEDRKRSYEAGVDFHFTKPADPVVLEEILHRLAQMLQPRMPTAPEQPAPSAGPAEQKSPSAHVPDRSQEAQDLMKLAVYR